MLLLIGASLTTGASNASFTHASSSTISASTAGAPVLLHLYSQFTDPDGLGSYYRRPGTTTPAATGSDTTLAVDLGLQPSTSVTCNRVFTIKTPPSFPAGITRVTVTATLVADPGTGIQPITQIGFASIGGTGRYNPITISAGVKRQCNLVVATPKPAGTAYHPTVLIAVTYSGFSGTFFRYSVPFTVTAN